MRVAAALAALATIALAACGGSRASNTATTPPPAGPHTFVDLVGELPNNLDETGTPSPASTAIVPSWESELVRPAAARPGPNAVLPGDNAVVPYLATTWQRLANGDYVFGLRRQAYGVTGDAFTAADVQWSIARAAARSPLAPFLFSLAHIDAAHPVTILGPHRVRINVTAPSPFTLSVLASPDLAIYDSRVYRAHASAGDPWAQQWGSTHSASYAAYYVAQYLPRAEIVLGANPGFWRSPYYTTVLIKQVVASDDRLTAVTNGSATHTSNLAWSDFATAVNADQSQGVSATVLQDGPAVLAWHLNVSHGPLSKPLVRQALGLAFDRSVLSTGLAPVLASPTALTIPAAFGQRQPRHYDPALARSLMRSAGYPHGFTIDVATNDSVTNGNAVAVLGPLDVQLYAQLAVTLHYVFVDNTDQLLALEAAHKVESSLEVTTPLLGGPGFLVEQDANTALDPVSPAAQEGYHNPTLQAALQQLLTSPPGAATSALIGQAATILDTDEPTVYLVTEPVQNVTRSNVTGYRAYTQPVTYYENLHASG